MSAVPYTLEMRISLKIGEFPCEFSGNIQLSFRVMSQIIALLSNENLSRSSQPYGADMILATAVFLSAVVYTKPAALFSLPAVARFLVGFILH